MNDAYCGHPRAGIVTNQPSGYDFSRALASRSTCADLACQAKASRWVKKTAGEQAHFVSDTPAALQIIPEHDEAVCSGTSDAICQECVESA